MTQRRWLTFSTSDTTRSASASTLSSTMTTSRSARTPSMRSSRWSAATKNATSSHPPATRRTHSSGARWARTSKKQIFDTRSTQTSARPSPRDSTAGDANSVPKRTKDRTRDTAAVGRECLRPHEASPFQDPPERGPQGFLPRRGSRPCRTIPGYGHVYMVFVHPDMWGHGVGRQLLQGLHERAYERGWSRTTLWTRASNAHARGLYEGQGYRRSGQEMTLGSGDPILEFERQTPLPATFGGGSLTATRSLGGPSARRY